MKKFVINVVLISLILGILMKKPKHDFIYRQICWNSVKTKCKSNEIFLLNAYKNICWTVTKTDIEDVHQIKM